MPNLDRAAFTCGGRDLASSVVLRSEDENEFREMLEAICSELQPSGYFEESLIASMAVSRWRLERISQIKRALVSGPYDPPSRNSRFASAALIPIRQTRKALAVANRLE